MNSDQQDTLNEELKEPEEGSVATPEGPRHKGIYLLPNLFTTSALFSGFYAIVAAINGHFVASSAAIFVAMVFDGLDGRVARLTNTQSPFGAEYDSLSDVIAFGLAPALVAFLWSLNGLGKLGWVCAFLYASGTALRLARFNTQIGTVDKKYFIGLACPSAAALVAGFIWAFSEAGISGEALAGPFAALVAIAGVLMVSNIRYYSFKDLGDRKRVPFVFMIFLIFIFALVAIDPASVLLTAAALYAASGPCYEAWLRLKLKKEKK